MRRTIIIFWIILLSAFSGNCSHIFAAGPWRGKIVDVETKEPLEGAVVLAVWERVYRTPAGANSYFYNAKEVVTNKAGEFEIPSYTPINMLPIISYMRGPLFTIFKPGYGSVNGMAIGDYFIGKGMTEQAFTIDGKWYSYASGVIELPKLKTREERLKRLLGISDPFLNHYENKKEYVRLLGIESTYLGLQPEYEPR